MNEKKFDKKGALVLIALLAMLASGCATQSPYAGLASAVSAINPKYADAASKLERALAAAAKPASAAPQAIDLDTIMSAAGFAKIETHYYRDTEVPAADLKKAVRYELIVIGSEAVEAKPSDKPAPPPQSDAELDLEAAAEALVGLLEAAEKAK